jgi:hypothetical protein
MNIGEGLGLGEEGIELKRKREWEKRRREGDCKRKMREEGERRKR